jgi:uncharacterized protein YcbX
MSESVGMLSSLHRYPVKSMMDESLNAGPCPRCVMTTLAQDDLPRDPMVLRTAAVHNGAHVGVYASVIHGGTIRRGDPVKVT